MGDSKIIYIDTHHIFAAGYHASFFPLFSMPHFFIRNNFISNLVLDNLKYRKLLELQGKS